MLAVFDADGKIVFEHKIPTEKKFESFIKSIETVLASAGVDEFSYCCCAAPGLVDHKKGELEFSGNLGWKNIPLKSRLEKLLRSTPVVVENDAKLAGLSEAMLVHDKYKKVLYLTISTGIGGGIIINGNIDSDFLNFEPGYMVLEHDGKLKKWEDFTSGKALRARYGKLASEIDDPGIWKAYAQDLAPGIEQLLAVIQPDVVIIGGGVGTHFEKFAAPLHEQLKRLENDMVKIPPIIKAQRPEEAVIYGCYELIRQQI